MLPQQAVPPPTPREDKDNKSEGRGRADNNKKLPTNGGASLGYEKMIYTTSTGASTGDHKGGNRFWAPTLHNLIRFAVGAGGAWASRTS